VEVTDSNGIDARLEPTSTGDLLIVLSGSDRPPDLPDGVEVPFGSRAVHGALVAVDMAGDCVSFPVTNPTGATSLMSVHRTIYETQGETVSWEVRPASAADAGDGQFCHRLSWRQRGLRADRRGGPGDAGVAAGRALANNLARCIRSSASETWSDPTRPGEPELHRPPHPVPGAAKGSLNVYAIYRNAPGDIIGGSEGYLDFDPAGGGTAGEITTVGTIPKVATTEVYADAGGPPAADWGRAPRAHAAVLWPRYVFREHAASGAGIGAVCESRSTARAQ
jgi:hypothetical protein